MLPLCIFTDTQILYYHLDVKRGDRETETETERDKRKTGWERERERGGWGEGNGEEELTTQESSLMPQSHGFEYLLSNPLFLGPCVNHLFIFQQIIQNF